MSIPQYFDEFFNERMIDNVDLGLLDNDLEGVACLFLKVNLLFPDFEVTYDQCLCFELTLCAFFKSSQN